MALPDNRKSVLITGCSPGGIGHSLALEFQRNGLRVFATARSRESLVDLEEKGIETMSLVVDDEKSVLACLGELKSILGDGKGLDILVNNAGRNYTVPALDVDMDEVRLTFETNIIGVIHMCKVFTPLIIEAKGTIVQIGSVAGIIPYVFGSVYNATKGALHSYSDTLRVELEPFGVNVVTIITGGVESRIARTPRTLAPDSLYQPIRSEYDRRVKHSQDKATPNEVYARRVATQVLYGPAPWRWLWPWKVNPRKWVWAGSKVISIYLLSGAWLWVGVFNYALGRMFNLGKLKNVDVRKTK
ncbi:NADPH-dependent 1-acyl dihydroxyacetone phosphate reductase [Microsporum audouinii]